MRVLSVYIEIKGCQVYVGEICGNTPEDARFSYAESYMENPETVPVSLSLPLLRLAMKKFDTMVSGFEEALQKAASFLENQGFENAEGIRKRILQNGGFYYLLQEKETAKGTPLEY